jgi:hypothetical protein
MNGFKTCVPPQDKNKKFLNRSLKELVTLEDIFKFTYEDIIQRVQSIDVFWFNERRFPSFIFEIEHTTDFKNALLKFLELQDFNIKMYIVSYKERHKEFLSKIELSPFKPIKGKTKFIDYERISQWHTKTYELMLTESKIIGAEL